MDSNSKSGSENLQVEANEALLDKAEAMIWALLDDQIETADIKRLEDLLQENEERYICCVQMHMNLHEHYDKSKLPVVVDKLPESPVLGSLGDLRPGTDSWPPVMK